MAHVDLSPEEVQVLISILEDFRAELRMEIADTDSGFYRRELKHERDVLDQIMDKLKTVPAAN